jgi:hypothetical protein
VGCVEDASDMEEPEEAVLDPLSLAGMNIIFDKVG